MPPRPDRACVIPALDAAASLAGVVHGARAAVPELCVIVVDDGSRDATRRVADECADEVVALDRNRGKGAALRAGFRVALGRGCHEIATLDADGQHDPWYLPAAFGALSGADIAIGARPRSGSSMPWRRRATNHLSSVAVSWCARQAIPDSQSGFRAFRAAVLARTAFGAWASDRYEYETALLLRAACAGCHIAYVPVPTAYARHGVSHFRPFRDTFRVVRTIAWSVVHSP
jgi:dolichol-phosphate mannosyltransferase